ncbi:hypothetical protein F383_07108 [Gossypium arboreum]|uniref:Uncharacterized protein n=1 Tax=Gossypium arboreum TaxID=29729 RepID=A0A0B0P9F6_GOSAR|nr:hypothetical protein F383_07108 [Gossypium arboreum]
MCYREGFSSDG